MPDGRDERPRSLEPSGPTALLVHDGELGDVRSLLEELSASTVERRGDLEREDAGRGWSVVVATPGRMLSLETGERPPLRIAILDAASHGERDALLDAGVDLIVRRPVHPSALRLLLLDSLYRAPSREGRERPSGRRGAGRAAGGDAAAKGADSGRERRRDPRRTFERRVISLGDQAARILMGRDVSAGGMRVDPTPGVEVGQELLIALYSQPGEQPLVVRAQVTRTDPDRGHVLEFRDLSSAAREILERMVSSLPALEAGGAGSDPSRLVVSEVVESGEPERAGRRLSP